MAERASRLRSLRQRLTGPWVVRARRRGTGVHYPGTYFDFHADGTTGSGPLIVARFAYRAGWPSRVVPPRRVGWAWVRVGPWIIGTVDRWDRRA